MGPIKNEREVNPIYFPSQSFLGLKPNYFFFLAAFLAVFLAAFLATFFADFAIAFLILCLNYTKSSNKKFIHKNFYAIIFKSDFFYKYLS